MENPLFVSKDNVSMVKALLEEGKGRLLIYNPELGYSFSGKKQVRAYVGDAEFTLFGDARIVGKSEVVARANHPDSRQYSLRKRFRSDDHLWEAAYDLFDKLMLPNNYVFQIHGLFTLGRSLFTEKGRTVYIPRGKGLEEGVLGELISLFISSLGKSGDETGLTEREVRFMVNYAAEDLESGRILQKNIRAGLEADALVGF